MEAPRCSQQQAKVGYVAAHAAGIPWNLVECFSSRVKGKAHSRFAKRPIFAIYVPCFKIAKRIQHVVPVRNIGKIGLNTYVHPDFYEPKSGHFCPL